MARIIVITSGKGGVGKTTVTAGLGRALVRSGKRVVLMDADLGLNNLDVVLGLERKVVYDVLDVVQNRCRVRQALVEDDDTPGLFVLPGTGYGDEKEIGGQAMRAILLSLSPSFDYVLIDCPAGIEAGFHRAVAASDEALLVTTPHVSALRDADKVAAILKSYALKTSIVLNRVRGDLVVGHEQLGWEDVEQLLQLPVVGVLPDDDIVGTYGCLSGEGKRTDGDEAIAYLAENLLHGTRRLFDATKKYKGFFGKIKCNLRKKV